MSDILCLTDSLLARKLMQTVIKLYINQVPFYIVLKRYYHINATAVHYLQSHVFIDICQTNLTSSTTQMKDQWPMIRGYDAI